MKLLKARGMRVAVKRAEPIDKREEDLMWSNGVLGDSSPQSLVDTMVYMWLLFSFEKQTRAQ